jgi:hypothetical protein
MKTSLPLLLLGRLLVMSAPAISQDSPPNAQQAKKIEALVTKAAALIES